VWEPRFVEWVMSSEKNNLNQLHAGKLFAIHNRVESRRAVVSALHPYPLIAEPLIEPDRRFISSKNVQLYPSRSGSHGAGFRLAHQSRSHPSPSPPRVNVQCNHVGPQLRRYTLHMGNDESYDSVTNLLGHTYNCVMLLGKLPHRFEIKAKLLLKAIFVQAKHCFQIASSVVPKKNSIVHRVVDLHSLIDVLRDLLKTATRIRRIKTKMRLVEDHSTRRTLQRFHLESELSAKLKLSRRAAIACREASCGDLAKRRGLSITRRLTEVGMVEDVEGIDTQFEI
jgi:hypothetical protein